MIFLASSCMLGNEARYLAECIETNMVSYNGPFVERFEKAVAQACDVRFAIATNTGTAALHIALILAGIGPGDKVVLPDITFIAPANAVRYVGAEPVFVDVEPDYWQMDMEKLSDYLKANGRGVKAIMPVHLHGHPVDLDILYGIAGRYGITVIEDAAEALGARYVHAPVGSLRTPQGLACLSFNGNKIVTCGGGGAILTNDPDLAKRAKHLTTTAKSDPLEYGHDEVGYNYRMTNIQAALGLAQIETLESRVQVKRTRALRYWEGLFRVPGLTLPKQARWAYSTYWMYSVLFDPLLFGKSAREVRDILWHDHEIETRTLWCPLHMQPPYRGCEAYKIEVAPRLYEQSLSLPVSVGLTQEDQARVIEAIKRIER